METRLFGHQSRKSQQKQTSLKTRRTPGIEQGEIAPNAILMITRQKMHDKIERKKGNTTET